MNKNTCTDCLLDNTDFCPKDKDKTTDNKICKDFIRLCSECPEYDTINHNCPLFCKFIRETLQECLVVELEEIKTEIQNLSTNNFLEMIPKGEAVRIVDNHIKELNNVI